MSTTYAKSQTTAQKKDANTAASVVDCSSQGEALQRKADMTNCAAQRVVQRDTGVVQRLSEADGKFMYVANLENNKYVDGYDLTTFDGGKIHINGNPTFKSMVPFCQGKIIFTKYHGGEIKSPGFTGCIMMFFHFKKAITDVISLIDPASDSLDSLGADDKFVAHAFCGDGEQDTKNALFDAEQRKLISIEAMFKPQTPKDGDNVLGKCTEQNIFVKGDDLAFTGSFEIDQYGRLGANVYAQNTDVHSAIKNLYQQADNRDMKLKHFNSEELEYQTKLTKIMIYAKVADKYGKLAEPSPDGGSMYELANLYYYKSKEIDIIKQIKEIANNDNDVLKEAKELISNSALKRYFDERICR